MLGGVHTELVDWMTRSERLSHQLVLLPRDHQKSAIAGFDAAWEITRNPAIRILYISSTANLAVKQLKFIKDILTSDIYRFYWPEMVNLEESKREKWTETEISIDHPIRKREAIRDSTIFTAGLTTSITGLHCDKTYIDDAVVKENAYTEEGREKTRQQYSLLSSIEGTDSRQLIVGTRYHPLDLYNDAMTMTVDTYDAEGNQIAGEPLYEKFERQVENIGDGSGEFIWPRQQRYDGKWFGFDQKILARKRAQYLDKIQYRSQYYNDPNDYETANISRDNFQYYDKKFLKQENGRWYFKGARLNVFAAIDFAYSLARRSDFTAIVVVGVDSNRNYYVLDIDRFKTDKISDYFKHILILHQKWDIRELHAECTAAQQMIVNDLRNSYIRPQGLALVVKDFKPTRHQGDKSERINACLQPRYEDRQIWHYKDGNCQILEDELVLSNPSHDDVKDCLAIAVSACIAPTLSRMKSRTPLWTTHSRFGGVN